MTDDALAADPAEGLVGTYRCDVFMPGRSQTESLTLKADRTYGYEFRDFGTPRPEPGLDSAPDDGLIPLPPFEDPSHRFGRGTWSVSVDNDSETLDLVDTSEATDTAFTRWSFTVDGGKLIARDVEAREFIKS